MSRPDAVDHFGASRYRYVYPPDRDGIFCVGNAAECDHLTGDGAVRIAWGRSPVPGDEKKVRSLHLCPTVAQLRRPALPAFLPDLVNLESMVVPTPLLAGLSGSGVAEGLRTLVVAHDHAYPTPATPFELALPGLRALMWSSPVDTPSLARVIDPLPPLEFLYANVSGDKAVLRQIHNLTTLRHLELADLKNVDVFDSIAAPLRALQIGRTGRDFPVAGLSTVPTVEALRLNGVRAEVDCAVFRTLPELVELDVLNTRKVANIEALLDCPKLASIRFLDCGNPFKKEGKALFRSRGFARLDIDYS
jgi:hypothetical protein